MKFGKLTKANQRLQPLFAGSSALWDPWNILFFVTHRTVGLGRSVVGCDSTGPSELHVLGPRRCLLCRRLGGFSASLRAGHSNTWRVERSGRNANPVGCFVRHRHQGQGRVLGPASLPDLHRGTKEAEAQLDNVLQEDTGQSAARPDSHFISAVQAGHDR